MNTIKQERRNQVPLKAYMLKIAGWLSLISTLVIALVIVIVSRNYIQQKSDARLLSSAVFFHELLGKEYHDHIVDEHSVSESEYLKMLNRNDNLCRQLGLQYLWSVLVVDNQLLFTSATRFDVDEPGSTYASFFEQHRDPASFKVAFGKPAIPVYSSFHNEWGDGRMVLVPHLDANGRRYMIGASIQLDSLKALAQLALIRAVLIATLLFILFGITMSWWIRRYTRIYSNIISASEEIASGNLDVLLPSSIILELNRVCEALDTMRIGLKERINKLAQNELREVRKNEILIELTKGKELQALLDTVVLFTEKEDPSIYGSILLLDPEKQILLQGSAPSLHPEYNALMEAGLPIGPNVGSCGTASYTKEIAIAADIQTDPKWTPYAAFIEQTQKHNLRACWSMPIISSTGEVLGAFANYSTKIGEPGSKNLETLKWAVSIAAIAIEKKRSLEALKLSDERYRSIISVSNTGAWEYHHSSGYLWCSPEYFTMLGLDPCLFVLDGKANLNETWIQLLHPEDRALAVQRFEDYLKSGSEVMYENNFRMRHANGSWLWILSRGSSLRNQDGTPAGKTLGTHINLTSQKMVELELIQAKERAEQSDRLKSAFLANMSHEIRTPMNGILGFAQLLKSPDLEMDELQDYIKIIEKSGHRLLNIINDIIDISKIEAGLIELRMTESNVITQIEYIYTFFKPEAEAKGLILTLNIRLSEEHATIITDREKLYAILTNLVKNALKYTHVGSIEIGCHLITINDANMVEIYVKDTGIGISEKMQGIIFERFMQADDGLSRKYEGAGLGLSIAKAYAEKMGGKIGVKSVEGKGSVFFINLPTNTTLQRETTDMQLKNNAFAAPSKKLKILIVEDDKASEVLLVETIKNFCNEILISRTGVEAVNECRNNPDIDLVLMDICMPEMDGYQATSLIREFNKTVVIIAQTAYGLSGDREKTLESGCNDYIDKPISKNALQSLISKYFANSM